MVKIDFDTRILRVAEIGAAVVAVVVVVAAAAVDDDLEEVRDPTDSLTTYTSHCSWPTEISTDQQHGEFHRWLCKDRPTDGYGLLAADNNEMS